MSDEINSFDAIAKQLNRLSKEVYKATSLMEMQAEQNRQALEQLQAQHTQTLATARLDLIKALLPIIDALEDGMRSGLQQARTVEADSSEAAEMLRSWLRGQQILRKRLLKVLEAEGVMQIPTVGAPFDPHQHMVVKVMHHSRKPDGAILATVREGFVYGETVIRYAEVAVNKRENL